MNIRFTSIFSSIIFALLSTIAYGLVETKEERPTLPDNICSYHMSNYAMGFLIEGRMHVFPFQAFGNIRWHTIINCGTCIFDEPVDLWANDPEKRSHIIVYRLSKEQVSRLWGEKTTKLDEGFNEPAEIDGLYAAAIIHHAGFMHNIVLARITFTIHALATGDKIATIKTITEPNLAVSAYDDGVKRPWYKGLVLWFVLLYGTIIVIYWYFW